MSGTVWEPKQGFETQEAEVADPRDVGEAGHEPNQTYDAQGLPENRANGGVQQAQVAVRRALAEAQVAREGASPAFSHLITAVEALLAALDAEDQSGGAAALRDNATPEQQE